MSYPSAAAVKAQHRLTEGDRTLASRPGEENTLAGFSFLARCMFLRGLEDLSGGISLEGCKPRRQEGTGAQRAVTEVPSLSAVPIRRLYNHGDRLRKVIHNGQWNKRQSSHPWNGLQQVW